MKKIENDEEQERGMQEKSKLYRRMRKRRQYSSQKASRIVDSRQVKSREVTELKEWTQIKSGNWREYNKKTGREGVGGWWEVHKKQSSRITAKKIRMNFPLDKEKKSSAQPLQSYFLFIFFIIIITIRESVRETRVESHSQENYFLLLFFLYSFSDAATSVVEEEYKIC